MTLFCVGTASAFGWLMAYYKMPQAILAGVSSWGMSFYETGFFIAGVFLLVGCFLDAIPAIIICGPILAPLAKSVMMDPVHFAMIGIVSLAFGLVTPPYGLCLMIACSVAGISLRSAIKDTMIMLLPMLAVLASSSCGQKCRSSFPASSPGVPQLTLFANKVALVTGGASGIGAATTRAFAREGAKVAFTWITSEAEAKAIEKEINDAGGKALAIKADLTKQAEVDRTFALVAEKLGPLDVLFANAGGILDRKPATETTLDLGTSVSTSM